jgi:hypothetical protein
MNPIDCNAVGAFKLPAYKYHQQQLIILPPSDRIAYLGRGVEKE